MFLKNLKLTNFKNITHKEFDFLPKINAFVGANGVGKTNILDAVHYLSLTKSYLNYSDAQNINFEADFFSIEGIFERDNAEDVIFCAVQEGKKKQLRRNAKQYERISEHIGKYPLVMISPYDSDLIKDGSDVRRRFIDNIISQSNKTYLNQLIRYQKVLNQRNSLLKYFHQNQTFNSISLEIYDVELVQLGSKIHQTRKEFITSFLPIFKNYYSFIAKEHETVSIDYNSQLNENNLDDLLRLNLTKDRSAQYSTQGIHKDDLQFTIAHYPIKKFGSQGQQKSYLIALKLAQLKVIKENLKTTPILLLDDIFDKLDEQRVEQLVKLVNDEHFGQIFITDTHAKRTQKIIERIDAQSKVFKL